jgi:hypothetical protein
MYADQVSKAALFQIHIIQEMLAKRIPAHSTKASDGKRGTVPLINLSIRWMHVVTLEHRHIPYPRWNSNLRSSSLKPSQYRLNQSDSKRYLLPGPYLCTGQRGPGPGRKISRGSILKKKIEIEVWYARKKKGCPRERNLRVIYTENTMFCLFCFVFAYT